jgi:hypothetical protein
MELQNSVKELQMSVNKMTADAEIQQRQTADKDAEIAKFSSQHDAVLAQLHQKVIDCHFIIVYSVDICRRTKPDVEIIRKQRCAGVVCDFLKV